MTKEAKYSGLCRLKVLQKKGKVSGDNRRSNGKEEDVTVLGLI